MRWLLALVLAAGASDAAAAPDARLAAVVTADDARQAIVLGATGEVYEPDGRGAWVHRLPSVTADPLTIAGRAGSSIVALGDGVVYRLADTGWSAIRLVQRGKAVLGAGRRALAAVGRQLYALDTLTRGEPTKLASVPGKVLALAAGAKAIVVATEAGVFRIEGAGKPVAIRAAPRRLQLVSERWALVDRGALDLRSQKLTAWPAGLTIGPASMSSDDALVVIATSRAGLELLRLRGTTWARDPLGISGTAVGISVDRAGRALVALADGRLALRGATGWTHSEVRDEPAAPRPGSPPALSQ